MNVAFWYLVIAYINGGQTMIPAGSEQQCEARAHVYEQSMHGVAGVYCLPGVYRDRQPGYPR